MGSLKLDENQKVIDTVLHSFFIFDPAKGWYCMESIGQTKKINKNTVERRAAFCKWSNQLCQAKETKFCSLMRRTPMVSHMCVIRGSWRRRTCLLKQREKQTESGVISIYLMIIIFPFVIMLMVTKNHFSIWTRNNQHSVFIKLRN